MAYATPMEGGIGSPPTLLGGGMQLSHAVIKGFVQADTSAECVFPCTAAPASLGQSLGSCVLPLPGVEGGGNLIHGKDRSILCIAVMPTRPSPLL